MTYKTIKRERPTTARTISRWKQRFEESGIEGLEAKHKGSQSRTATPRVQTKVYRRVQQKPPDGSTHWSVRKLAAEIGVSKSSVHRILAQARRGRGAWNDTWRATIPISRPERPTLSDPIWNHRSFGPPDSEIHPSLR